MINVQQELGSGTDLAFYDNLLNLRSSLIRYTDVDSDCGAWNADSIPDYEDYELQPIIYTVRRTSLASRTKGSP